MQLEMKWLTKEHTMVSIAEIEHSTFGERV